RHTRFDCDWSSDVCSSDLTSWDIGRGDETQPPSIRVRGLLLRRLVLLEDVPGPLAAIGGVIGNLPDLIGVLRLDGLGAWVLRSKIGRASCRERVECWGDW